MKVALATAADESWSRGLRADVEAVARRDRVGEHSLVEDPFDADVILFVDPHQNLPDWTMRSFRRHPLVRRFPHKVFVYDERDNPRDVLPGIFVSMPRREFDRERQRAFGYYWLKNDTSGIVNDDPDLLFSFQGRRVGSTREAVLAVSHPRAVVEDTSQHEFFAGASAELEPARARYRETIGRSKFVLCPRGAATCTFRLFEAMACGRVPVVLSDEWVPPEDIDWDSCSLRVRESEAGTVAELLERAEASWPELSAGAKRVYEEWFAPDIWFHRAVEHLHELLLAGSGVGPGMWLRPGLWRDGARQAKENLTRKLRR